MSEVLIYRLVMNRDAILEDLEADQVLDYLYQEDVLDSDSYEEVRDKGPRKKQAELLLSHVEQKSSAIEKMIEGLKRSSQRHLAEILEHPLDNEARLSIGISKSFQDDLIYPMTNVPCGYAVIINNSVFDAKMEVREGSEEDVRNMKDLFEYLQFTVDIYENQTAGEIGHIVRKYAVEVDHKKYDCFVLFLMSHGFPQGIFGTDGEKVYLQRIREQLTAKKCFGLVGKPKLIFVQACRGGEADQGFVMTDSPLLPGTTPSQEGGNYPTHTPDNLDTSHTTSNNQIPEVGVERIPEDADIYTAYASTSNYAALRNTQTGGWFVKQLYEVVRKSAKTEDLQSMMVKVTNQVSMKRSKHGKQGEIEKYSNMQCPQFEGNLRKKVFFNPKKSNS